VTNWRNLITVGAVVALTFGGLAVPSAASALASSRVSAKLSVSKPVAGSVQTLKVRVVSAGRVAGGAVTISYKRGYERATRTATVNARGTATFRLTALAKGKHRIALTFAGTSRAAADTGSLIYTSRAAAPATVVGHVRDADTGEANPHVRVVGSSQDGVGSTTLAHPSASGRFEMKVQPGTYLFHTSINPRTGYSSTSGKKTLTIKPGRRYHLDFTTSLGATLIGRVREDGEQLSAEVGVEVVASSAGSVVSSVWTENGGGFGFTGDNDWPARIPAGTYLVRVTTESGRVSWYPNATSIADAVPITLGRGEGRRIEVELPAE
jgi:hypothetical protein